MGHLARVDGERRAIQAMDWSSDGKQKKKRGRPRKNGQETIREDIRCMDITWSEVIDLQRWMEGLRRPMCRNAWEVLSSK